MVRIASSSLSLENLNPALSECPLLSQKQTFDERQYMALREQWRKSVRSKMIGKDVIERILSHLKRIDVAREEK